MNEEIPEAVKEFWPRLRQLFEKESLQLVKEERERTPEAPDYQNLGIMAVAVSKLLDRLDVAMQPSLNAKPVAQKKLVAKLSNPSKS